MKKKSGRGKPWNACESLRTLFFPLLLVCFVLVEAEGVKWVFPFTINSGQPCFQALGCIHSDIRLSPPLIMPCREGSAPQSHSSGRSCGLEVLPSLGCYSNRVTKGCTEHMLLLAFLEVCLSPSRHDLSMITAELPTPRMLWKPDKIITMADGRNWCMFWQNTPTIISWDHFCTAEFPNMVT